MQLSGNVNLTAPVTLAADTVLDLNGFEITGLLSSALFNVNGKKLTLKGNGTIRNQERIAEITNGGQVTIENGTYITRQEGFTLNGTGSELVMNGGTIRTQETAIVPQHGSYVEINGGLIETADGIGIATSSTSGNGENMIIINGGRIDAHSTSEGYEACAVYIANHDIFVMTDGELIGNNGCGICMRAGDVTIHGGSITATGEAGTTGKISDDDFRTQANQAYQEETQLIFDQENPNPDAVLTVDMQTKPTLTIEEALSGNPLFMRMSKDRLLFANRENDFEMTKSAVIYHERADYPGKEGMQLTIDGGTITGVDHAVEVLSDEETPQVFVTGGTFTPAYPET